MDAAIRVEGLTKQFGELPVLRGIDCAIGASDGDFDQTEKDVVRRMCAELELDATAFGL